MSNTDLSVTNFDEIDEIAIASGRGSRSASTFNMLHGINHRQPGVSSVPTNQDSVGFTFFTKPVMNLAYDNINRIRKLEFLTDQDPKSMGCAMKAMLSPNVLHGHLPREPEGVSYNSNGIPYRNVRSAIVDDRQAFIPLLTNSLINLSGWSDLSMDTFTTDEGLFKESMSWIDSRPVIYGTRDFTANFRNMEGDPITTLFEAWLEYAGRVSDGSIYPYAQHILNKTIDYTTRIYVLVLDRSRTVLQKIACTGGAFPLATPNAVTFNTNNNENIFTENNQISIPFRVNGIWYNDPIIVREFNRTVEMFCPDMDDSIRSKQMTKLTGPLLNYFGQRGYPRIEQMVAESKGIRNYELSWYYYTEMVNKVKAKFKL